MHMDMTPIRVPRLRAPNRGGVWWLRIEKRRIAVGPRAATARIVLDQQGHSAAHDRRKNAEHEVGPAPSHGVDQ
jgi:hypothetical protein